MFAWKWRNGTLFDADHKHRKQHGSDSSSSVDLADVDAKGDVESAGGTAVVLADASTKQVQVAELDVGDVQPGDVQPGELRARA
jgi:hypothetical protein